MASLPPSMRYKPYDENDGLGDECYGIVLAAQRFIAAPLLPYPLAQVPDISFFDFSHALWFSKQNVIQKLESLVLRTMANKYRHAPDSVYYQAGVEKYQLPLAQMNENYPVKSIILAENMFPANVAMLVVRFEAPTESMYDEGAIVIARVDNAPFEQSRMKTWRGDPNFRLVERLRENLTKTGGIRYYEEGGQTGYCEDLYIKGTEKHRVVYEFLCDMNELLLRHRKLVLFKHPAELERKYMDLGCYYTDPTNALEDGQEMENGQAITNGEDTVEEIGEHSTVMSSDYNADSELSDETVT